MGISEFVRNYNERFLFDPGHGTRKVGIAIDYPITRKDNYRSGRADDILELLVVRDGWSVYVDEISREALGIEKDGVRVERGVGDGTLRVKIGLRPSLWGLEALHKPLISSIYDATRGSNVMLLGYGAQPVCHKQEWTNLTLYRVIRESLAEKFLVREREEKSYHGAHRAALAASSWVSVEVGREEFGKALIVFNAISAFCTALFGNSPLCLAVNATGGELVSRNKCFLDIPRAYRDFPSDSIEDMEDYLRYMTNLKLLVARGDATYYQPETAFTNFIRGREEEEVMQNFFLQERLLWWSAIPRGETGTIAVRTCTQPHEDQLSFAAFILGIAENVDEVAALLNLPEGWVFCELLETHAVQYGLGAGWEKLGIFPIFTVLEQLLELAEKGLKKRAMGEHMLLLPLRERLRERKNPAEKAMSIYSDIGSSGWVDLLSYLARI